MSALFDIYRRIVTWLRQLEIIRVTDNEHLSLMPLMRAQLAHELSLYRRAEWKQGTPPHEGHYLVTVQTDEGPPFVRLERWDGRAWVTAGGYVTVRAWDYLPAPAEP